MANTDSQAADVLKRPAPAALLAIVTFAFAVLSACSPKPDMNSYDLEKKEEPTCAVYVDFSSPSEAATFAAVLQEFAAKHSIPESRLKAISDFPSPTFRTLPLHVNKDLMISGMAYIGTNEPYGQARMSLVRRSFPLAEFKTLCDDFRRAFEAGFTNRVRFDSDSGYQ